MPPDVESKQQLCACINASCGELILDKRKSSQVSINVKNFFLRHIKHKSFATCRQSNPDTTSLREITFFINLIVHRPGTCPPSHPGVGFSNSSGLSFHRSMTSNVEKLYLMCRYCACECMTTAGNHDQKVFCIAVTFNNEYANI